MAQQRVPSPEEIRLLILRRENGGQEIAVDRLEALEKKVAQRGRKSPAELRDALELLMQKFDMQPAEELVKMAMETRELEDGSKVWALAPELRARILSDLMQYQMPKLKAVEVSGTVDHNHTIMIVRYGEDGAVRREPINVKAEVSRG
jgi:hypothetical protein